MPVSELQLMNKLLGAASSRIPTLRLFRRQVLNLEFEPGMRVKAGIPGQADLYGVVKGTARLIEIELKAAAGRISEAQIRWEKWCDDWGVRYLLLKAMHRETPEETIERWIEELEREVSAGSPSLTPDHERLGM